MPELQSAVDASIKNTRLYRDKSEAHVAGNRRGEVRVFDASSFYIARPLVAENHRVAVLNMASATNAGGGVANGANAQEECLCRESTLYPCLKTDLLWRDYYSFHRKRNDAAYTDAVIFTPEVIVLNEPRFTADVVSVAAPNLGRCNLDTQAAAKLIKARIAKVMDICAAQGDTALVLGALGCGAFRNDPKLVARELKTLLYDDGYAKLFDRVDFAVLGRGEVGRANYQEFKSALSL
jgi:uncharacterized protein (TIGR02452 family)